VAQNDLPVRGKQIAVPAEDREGRCQRFEKSGSFSRDGLLPKTRGLDEGTRRDRQIGEKDQSTKHVNLQT